MGFIQEFFAKFKRRKVAKQLRRFIAEWEVFLPIFQQIEANNNDTAVASILRGHKRYDELIKSFDLLFIRVEQHNTEIRTLQTQFDEIIAKHSKKEILEHIDLYPIEQLQQFNDIALKISRYTIPNSFSQKQKYLRYMVDIGELVNDYKKIVEQFSLIRDFESLDFSFDDTYIDKITAETILSPAREILNQAKAYGTKYYTIPELDEKIVDRHNEKFIKNHLNDAIFNSINGKSLDEDQRRAILCDPKSNLTIAGAGAGKTLTICGKVKWLLETGKATADEILLMSYSNESAKDLSEKANKICKGLTVKTFHSLGLEILNRFNGSKRAINDQFNAYIKKFFDKELGNNPDTANAIFRFVSLYLYTNSFSEKKYADDGEKFEDMKKSDFRTLKNKLIDLSNDNYETIQRELVKSYEELVIANFLFTNGIEYEYERAYEIDTSTPEKRQYTPDFYLTDYKIYLEHYGIDKKGRTPQYSAEEEKNYLSGIGWKRRTHLLNKTTCIETYSYEFKDGTIFNNLTKRLQAKGVKFKPLTQQEIYSALNTIYEGQEFASLFNLITTFLNLYKAQYSDAKGFEELKSYSLGSRYEDERAHEFLEICKGIYTYYIRELRAENKIDFDDMILQSTSVLDKLAGYRYKYVIVDEFQDISQSRTRFLKKIIEHGNSKLFAVGDDWQAIYRFAGCDINVFLQFRQLFYDAKLNYITSTHRNSAELQAIVEPFITANPEQYKKHIQSEKHENSPIRIIYHDKNRPVAFTKALQNISKIKPNAEILVLGRNRNDINSVITDKAIKLKDNTISHSKFPQMQITYKTVHQSKGLESDFVVLISGEDAKNGFPNKMEDDKLLDLVLGKKGGYEFAEERRLFYVALTRTRSIVYILSDKNSPSIFVKEIEERVKIENPDLRRNDSASSYLCPMCKSGKLIFHDSKNLARPFYGCSNFPYCKYTINNIKAVQINNRCPECGDFLVIRDGRYGRFIGCYNIRCKFTKSLKEGFSSLNQIGFR